MKVENHTESQGWYRSASSGQGGAALGGDSPAVHGMTRSDRGTINWRIFNGTSGDDYSGINIINLRLAYSGRTTGRGRRFEPAQNAAG
jgi:hypothetical protein